MNHHILYTACLTGDIAVVRRAATLKPELIRENLNDDTKIDINDVVTGMQTTACRNPLQAALAGVASAEVVELLLKNGAEPSCEMLEIIVNNKYASKEDLAHCLILMANTGIELDIRVIGALMNDYNELELIKALIIVLVMRGQKDFLRMIPDIHIENLSCADIEKYLAKIETKDYDSSAKRMFNFLKEIKAIDANKCFALIDAFTQSGTDKQVVKNNHAFDLLQTQYTTLERNQTIMEDQIKTLQVMVNESSKQQALSTKCVNEVRDELVTKLERQIAAIEERVDQLSSVSTRDTAKPRSMQG